MAKSRTMEQLEAQKARAKARGDAAKREQRTLEAQMRAVERKTTEKRRLRWATIAEQIGLFQLDDTTLQEVLTVALAMVNRHGGRMPRTTGDNATGIAELGGIEVLVLERDCAPDGMEDDHGDRRVLPERDTLSQCTSTGHNGAHQEAKTVTPDR